MMKNNFLFKLGNCIYVEGMHTIAWTQKDKQQFKSFHDLLFVYDRGG